MVGSNTAIIKFDAQVLLQDRGDRWAAYIDPPGLTVYGATQSAVRARVDQAMEFFLIHFSNNPDGARKLQQYLDSHRVAKSVKEYSETIPTRRRSMVNLPVEVELSA